MSVADAIIQIDERKENPLRKKAHLILKKEFATPHLQEILAAMRRALDRESDGVALAAPQIGLPLSIFIISPKAYKEEAKWKPLVFINPTIIKTSKKTKTMEEGCLSVRWIYGKTKRAMGVTIQAYDEQGTLFSYGATGLIAQIFQHETDHLNGILFIDHGHDFKEFTEEEVRAAEHTS